MILKLTKQEVQLIISLAQKIIIATEQQEQKEKAQKDMQLSKVNPNCEVCED